MGDEGVQLLIFFPLSGLRPASRLKLLIQLGIGVDGEHGGADELGVELIEDLRAGQSGTLPLPRPGDAGEVEEAVADARLVQPPALDENILWGIALVHEGQGGAVPGLHAEGQAVVPGGPEPVQLSIGFQPHVGDPGEGPDGLDGGDRLADEPGDVQQAVRLQHKGVGPGEKGPVRPWLDGPALKGGGQLPHRGVEGGLDLQQVGLDLLQRGHAEGEGQVVVKGAEFTAMVGTARRHLDEQGGGLIGRPPDGAGKVHCRRSFRGWDRRGPSAVETTLLQRNQERKYGLFLE